MSLPRHEVEVEFSSTNAGADIAGQVAQQLDYLHAAVTAEAGRLRVVCRVAATSEPAAALYARNRTYDALLSIGCGSAELRSLKVTTLLDKAASVSAR